MEEPLFTIRPATLKSVATCVVSLIACAAVATAQTVGGSADIGVLTMQYADSIDATALALTPAAWMESRLTSVSAAGTFSRMDRGAWSAQGGVDGSLFTPRKGLLLGEIEGAAGGSAHRDGSRTGQFLATARGHVTSASRGAWLGGGLGATWDGGTWRNVKQGEAAAWTRIGAATAFASLTPTMVDDSIKYTDAQFSANAALSRIELDASAGFRSGSRLPTLGGNAKSWGSASVTGWIRSRVAIVASAGTYPVDLTQGFPGGRFASLSVRIGNRRFPPSSSSVPDLDDLSAAKRNANGMAAFELRDAGTNRELRVRAPSAITVELMGDFTDWKPVAMSSDSDGWWSVALPIREGIHEINVRIDGGKWTAPAGLTSKSDEFGGVVGVLIVR